MDGRDSKPPIPGWFGLDLAQFPCVTTKYYQNDIMLPSSPMLTGGLAVRAVWSDVRVLKTRRHFRFVLRSPS